MTKRLSAAAILVLGVALLFGQAEAKTKSNPVIEVNIPYVFHLGQRTLPAGSYTFELATGAPNPGDTVSVLIVRNREAKVYQAVAVSAQPGVGLPTESKVDLSEGDEHVLVSVWKNGSRFDLQPGKVSAANQVDDWTRTARLVTVSANFSDRQ
jgi:hypothetical protein